MLVARSVHEKYCPVVVFMMNNFTDLITVYQNTSFLLLFYFVKKGRIA